MLTSNSGRVVIFDYDHANLQSLQPAIERHGADVRPDIIGYMYSSSQRPTGSRSDHRAPVNFTSYADAYTLVSING